VERWATPHFAAQAEYWRHLGTAADVLERDGVWAVRTGISSNTENGVVSTGAVAEAVAAEFLAWLSDVPASWLCAEGNDETPSVLVSAGCRPENDAWEMSADVDHIDVDAPDGITIVSVSSEAELDAWLDVAGPCGWLDTPGDRDARRQLHVGLGFATPLCLYVGLRDDVPVAMASAFYGQEIVYLTDLAVLGHERGRGIGRSLAATRLDEGRRRGCKTAVLAASPNGAKLYRALGFEAHRQPSDRWFYLPEG